MPRDAVSRTANVERTGRHKWVNADAQPEPEGGVQIQGAKPCARGLMFLNCHIYSDARPVRRQTPYRSDLSYLPTPVQQCSTRIQSKCHRLGTLILLINS